MWSVIQSVSWRIIHDLCEIATKTVPDNGDRLLKRCVLFKMTLLLFLKSCRRNCQITLSDGSFKCEEFWCLLEIFTSEQHTTEVAKTGSENANHICQHTFDPLWTGHLLLTCHRSWIVFHLSFFHAFTSSSQSTELQVHCQRLQLASLSSLGYTIVDSWLVLDLQYGILLSTWCTVIGSWFVRYAQHRSNFAKRSKLTYLIQTISQHCSNWIGYQNSCRSNMESRTASQFRSRQ